MARITDQSAGVPGGYYMQEDGTIVDAFGRPREAVSDAELAKWPVYQQRVEVKPAPTQRVELVTTEQIEREQAQIKKDREAAAKAMREGSRTGLAEVDTEAVAAETARLAKIERDRIVAEADAKVADAESAVASAKQTDEAVARARKEPAVAKKGKR